MPVEKIYLTKKAVTIFWWVYEKIIFLRAHWCGNDSIVRSMYSVLAYNFWKLFPWNLQMLLGSLTYINWFFKPINQLTASFKIAWNVKERNPDAYRTMVHPKPVPSQDVIIWKDTNICLDYFTAGQPMMLLRVPISFTFGISPLVNPTFSLGLVSSSIGLFYFAWKYVFS